MDPLEAIRREKDDFFANDPRSPLELSQRETFKGLNYFPVDQSLRFELDFEPADQREVVQMLTSTGEVQAYHRLGRIRFSVAGRAAELTVFENEGGLFLPFVDALAGKETYGAGRYLEPVFLSSGRLIIDFNLAYNPYCAYNHNWSCPIPPAENRLNVPIRAGEKLFSEQARPPAAPSPVPSGN